MYGSTPPRGPIKPFFAPLELFYCLYHFFSLQINHFLLLTQSLSRFDWFVETEKCVHFLAPCSSRIIFQVLTHDWFDRKTTNTKERNLIQFWAAVCGEERCVLCDDPYETNRSAADLQQICFTKNRLATDHFIVCKVCFQSVADALPSSSAKMFSCRRETDEKQICTWSVKSAESVRRLN